jgi:hypothetical protein
MVRVEQEDGQECSLLVAAEVYRSPVRENLQRAEYPVVHSKSDSTVRRPAQDTRALLDITRAPDGKPLVCASVPE